VVVHRARMQVPAYAAAQIMGATAASLTLRLLFGNAREHFFGTVPAGSDVQSLVIEFIISFNLMFVVSGVATDNRAVSMQRPHVSSTLWSEIICELIQSNPI
jgi:glycerol uptake facilitator-like aquaporin